MISSWDFAPERWVIVTVHDFQKFWRTRGTLWVRRELRELLKSLRSDRAACYGHLIINLRKNR